MYSYCYGIYKFVVHHPHIAMENEFPDFNEMMPRQNSLPLCDSIKILDILMIKPKMRPWFICEHDNKCNITVPSNWLLFCDDTYICDVRIERFEMVNYEPTRPNWITLCSFRRIDKELFDFSRNMHFRRDGADKASANA